MAGWNCRAVLLMLGPQGAGRVNFFGVGLLVLGAVLGFFAVPISRKVLPKGEADANLLRYVGLGLAIVGTLLAIRVFG